MYPVMLRDNVTFQHVFNSFSSSPPTRSHLANPLSSNGFIDCGLKNQWALLFLPQHTVLTPCTHTPCTLHQSHQYTTFYCRSASTPLILKRNCLIGLKIQAAPVHVPSWNTTLLSRNFLLFYQLSRSQQHKECREWPGQGQLPRSVLSMKSKQATPAKLSNGAAAVCGQLEGPSCDSCPAAPGGACPSCRTAPRHHFSSLPLILALDKTYSELEDLEWLLN